jgi:hypothetical protein
MMIIQTICSVLNSVFNVFLYIFSMLFVAILKLYWCITIYERLLFRALKDVSARNTKFDVKLCKLKHQNKISHRR